MSRINGTAEHAWRVLRKHPNATAREVAAHMGVPIMTASNALRRLQGRGDAVYSGGGRWGRWTLITQK